DQLYVTPEITAAFNQAHNGGGSSPGRNPSNGGSRNPPQNNNPPPQNNNPPPQNNNPPPRGDGSLAHTAWPEQLENTPLPVFVRPQNLEAAHYTVHYRGLGMSSFATLELSRVGNGYGGEIPCGQIIQPRVEYYVTATDESGSVLAAVSSEEEPTQVR